MALFIESSPRFWRGWRHSALSGAKKCRYDHSREVSAAPIWREPYGLQQA